MIESRKKNPELYTKKKLVKNNRLHNIWSGMKRRCNNPNNEAYARYGGRGIKVCDEWSAEKNGYWNFEKWSLMNGYQDDLSIDRIDNDGDYEPSNCRWTTMKQQGNNTQFNIFLEYQGVRLTLKEWSEYLEVPYHVIHQRYKRGWNAHDILTKSRRDYKKIPMELIPIKKIKIENIKSLSH